MIKKLLLIAAAATIAISSTACSYFFPIEKEIKAPLLIESEKIIMPTTQIRKGDLIVFHDLESTFVPEPTNITVGELERTGVIEQVYFNKGQKVNNGDLVIKLDTNLVEERIVRQQISLEKSRLEYEENLILYETGKIDKYTLEFSRLSLESAQNYIQDLKEEYEQHFVYSPANGVIVDMNFAEGARAWGDVFSVSDSAIGVFEVTMRVNVDNRTPAEVALMNLNKGDAITIIYEGEKYEGEIFRDIGTYYMEIGYDPENNHTHAKVRKKPDDITFGKKATLRIITEQALDAVVIPKDAVYSADDDPYTYVVKEDLIEKTYIELGMDDGSFYEVVSGLEEGDTILKVN